MNRAPCPTVPQLCPGQPCPVPPPLIGGTGHSTVSRHSAKRSTRDRIASKRFTRRNFHLYVRDAIPRITEHGKREALQVPPGAPSEPTVTKW